MSGHKYMLVVSVEVGGFLLVKMKQCLNFLGVVLPRELRDSLREPDMIWCQVAMRHFYKIIHSVIGCVSLISKRCIIVGTSNMRNLELTPEITWALRIPLLSYFVNVEDINYTILKSRDNMLSFGEALDIMADNITHGFPSGGHYHKHISTAITGT